jgi:hypothetical protein
MLIAKAPAHAPVEVLEGQSRPLKRTRRRSDSGFPGLPRVLSWIAEHWFDRHAARARKIVDAGRG